jgi:HK97 family phage prohead protease/HK97 family phage major capsid protein
MQLTFSSNIECDQGRRLISGKIVPYDGEIGQTSVGAVVFERGSIQLPEPGKSKLLLEHDAKKPIGKAVSFNETSDGVYASFKVSNTSRGTDSLIEASDGLRSGLSVGVEVLASQPRNGVLYVQSARLFETSLVQAAAFDSAAVTSVAASSPENEDEALPEITQPESEAILDTPDAVTPEAVVETPAVEASRPTITAAMYSTPRIELTKEKFLENTIRAQFGDDDARQYLRAAANTTDNAGLVPTRQLTEVINPLANADRPFIDAISRGVLPDAGMTFEIPKISQVPTVAVTAEEAAPSNTDLEDAYLSVAVQKFAGQQTFSVEILDRSSPAFYAELVKNMEFAYAKATDARVASVVVAAASDIENRTMSAANLLDFVSDAAVSIYSNTLGFAQNIVVSPAQWGAIMGLVDSTNRAIYTAINPVNAGGSASPTSLRGQINGLNLFVDRNLSGTGDGTIVVLNPDSYTWYESPTFKLEANVIASGQINVAYYGYGAIATKVAAGAYKWMVA